MTFLPQTRQPHLLIVLVFTLLNLGSATAQQCTLPSRIFLPTTDPAISEQFGTAVDIDGQYMVAGLPDNSAQQIYSGKAIVFKLGGDNVWVKIAELTPSNPGKHRNFGNSVSIYGNSIVVSAHEYNDVGISRTKLYVFEKPGSEWMSATENYTIIKPFGGVTSFERFGKFDLHNNELVAIWHANRVATIEVYTKTSGSFSLAQTIPAPVGHGFGYDWFMALGTDLIVLANEQFHQPDGSNGGAFIYSRTAGNYQTSPHVLRSALQTITRFEGFGTAIAISDQTIFITGLHESSGEYNQSFYIFEKPVGGWTSAALPIMFEAPGYAQSNIQLIANDQYVFSAGQDFSHIVGFKKPVGGWSASATRFFLNAAASDRAQIGRKLLLSGNHLIAGCPTRFLWNGLPRELIIDFQATTGTWEGSDVIVQEITNPNNINAADDLFGISFGVHGNQLAVSANQDDGQGSNSGVVYTFDGQGTKQEPDQKIFNPEVENNTGFGNSIAISDSVMFIGAPYKDSLNADGTRAVFGIGKVYIYRLTESGWSYSSQIKAPVIRANMNFGRRVAASNGYCAVTEFYSGSSESVGRVHIYKEDPLTKQFNYIATLNPSTPLRSDFFGSSMVMTDTLMVIGTGNFAPNASYRHSVYVFKKNNEWESGTEDARLYSTDSGWSDRFGASVSMSGKYIVVGAPYSPGYDPRPIPRPYAISGAAYIFKQPPGGWRGELTQIAKLTPSDPIELGTFGTTVAIDRNDIFIGSPNRYDQYNTTDNFANPDRIPGKVYHFKKAVGDEWISTDQAVRQIQSFEPENIDGYGATMFISDRYLYVGAMLDDTQAGFRSGSVQTMMQLPAIDDFPTVICLDDTPFRLTGFPRNGTWSGTGIHPVTGLFNPAVAGAGSHTITYERSGCEATAVIEVQANEMIVTQQSLALQVKCIGFTVPIVFESNREVSEYRWFYKATANGVYQKFDSLKQSIVAKLPGYYQVIVDRGICPDRFQTFQVADEPPVSITIEQVPTICNNDEVQLTASPASGEWEGASTSLTGVINPTGLNDGMHKIYYHYTTGLGCRWKDSVTVNIDKLVQPTIDYNGELICGDNPAELLVHPVDSRSRVGWYGPDGNKLDGKSTTRITVDEPGEYTAEVNKYTCTLITPPVMVGAVEDSLFVPNVFTPNKDGYNDFFEARHHGIENFQLLVVNRYGRQVFETKDVDFKWTAQNTASGIYYWTIWYTTCWNERKTIKGWVQIIH